jgi:hypothetical protein
MNFETLNLLIVVSTYLGETFSSNYLMFVCIYLCICIRIDIYSLISIFMCLRKLRKHWQSENKMSFNDLCQIVIGNDKYFIATKFMDICILCVNIRIHVSMYTYVSVHMCKNIYVCIHTCMHTYIYIYIYIYVYMYAYTHSYIYIYIYIYTYIYAHIHIYIYLYTYTYIHTYSKLDMYT